MKTLLLAAALALLLPALRAADAPVSLDAAFQEALLLEEGRRDLPAALRAYEAVVALVDAQRALAATAVFRLGEVHRKLGRTNDAVAQYRRLLRDFPGEDTLARLSRENLAALGTSLAERGGDAPVVPQGRDVRGAPPRELAADEIARLEALLQGLEELGPGNDSAMRLMQEVFPDAALTKSYQAFLQLANRLTVLNNYPEAEQETVQREIRRTQADLTSVEEEKQFHWERVLQAQRVRLRALKAAQPADAAKPPSQAAVSPAAEEIARLEAQLAELEKLSPNQPAALIALQQAFPDAQLERIEAEIFSVEQRLASLRASLADGHPDVRGAVQQHLLLQERRHQRWLAVLEAQRLRLRALKAALPGHVTFFGDLHGTLEVPPGGTLSLADSILRLKPTNLTDLRRVRVHRPAAAGGTNLIVEVNVRDLLRDNDRSKDVQLHPGDRVEIPQRVF